MEKWAHLWPQPGDWKAYEAYVSGSLKRRFPHAEIKTNQKMPGKKSGVIRQIDVLVSVREPVVVDCKCYRRKVHVKDVEAFLGMLDDLCVEFGILVTTRGYSKAALSRAKNDPRNIDLQILTPDRLSEYQHVGAPLIWKDSVGVFLECPEGWVTDSDGTSDRGYLVAMYPLGDTLESAQRHSEFLYANILRKGDDGSLEKLAAEHEETISADSPRATIEHRSVELVDQDGKNRQALLRVANIPKMNFGTEHSLYVDYTTHALLLVLLAPPNCARASDFLIEVGSKSFELKVSDKRNCAGPEP